MNNLILPKNWRVFDTAQQVAEHTVQSILSAAQQAVLERGAFHLVTAGGTTPLAVYRQLLAVEQSTAFNGSTVKMDWSKWHIYLGDERCLPAQDLERNSVALDQAWLKHSGIPAANIHFMSTEHGAQQAALAYEKWVKNQVFDVVLLGMGEDGHTASLFPGRALLNHAHCVLIESNSPKPPAQRVTLSAECLAKTRLMLKLVTGQAKQAAVAQWLAGADLPIAQVNAHLANNDNGQTWVLCSADSLPMILIT